MLDVLTSILPKTCKDKWLWLSVLVAMIPIFYISCCNYVSYMTISFIVGLVIFVVLCTELILMATKKQKIEISKNPTFWFFVAFVCWLVLGSPFTISTKATFFGSIDGRHITESIFQFVCYAFFAVAAAKAKPDNRNWLLSLLVWLSCIYILFGIVDPQNKHSWFSNGSHAYALMFFHPNHSGYLMCMTGVVAGSKVLLSSKWWGKVAFGVAFLWHALFLCLNCSMGPILGLVAGIVALVVYFAVKKKKIAFFAAALFAGFVAISCLVDFVPQIKKAAAEDTPLYARVAATACYVLNIDYTYNDEAVAGADGWDRKIMWKNCLKNAAKRPLFGTGVGTYHLTDEETFAYNPHNEFLQYLSNGGIPALMFYVAGVISLFVSALKKKQLSVAGVCSVAGIVAYVVSSFFGNTIVGVMSNFALVLGIATKETAKEE